MLHAALSPHSPGYGHQHEHLDCSSTTQTTRALGTSGSPLSPEPAGATPTVSLCGLLCLLLLPLRIPRLPLHRGLGRGLVFELLLSRNSPSSLSRSLSRLANASIVSSRGFAPAASCSASRYRRSIRSSLSNPNPEKNLAQIFFRRLLSKSKGKWHTGGRTQKNTADVSRRVTLLPVGGDGGSGWTRVLRYRLRVPAIAAQ